MTPDDIIANFRAVAGALGAEPGEGDYYRGIREGVPFLLKITAAEPPGCLLKLRMDEPHDLPSTWTDSLPQHYRSANLECEIEGDYLYIWVHDMTGLDPGAIADLVPSCIAFHADLFPQRTVHCFDCLKSGAATLVQSGAMVSTICASCLAVRAEAHQAKEWQLNWSTGVLGPLVPAALALSAAGWALCWILLDAAMQWAQVEVIKVPRIVVAALVLGVGYLLGWPVGKLLLRSGAVKRIPAGALAVATTAVTVVAGEILYTAYVIRSETGSMDPVLILRAALPLALAGGLMFVFLKLCLAVTLGMAIHQFARPKQAKLAI